MTRQVALLGGINVGGHRVTMDRLRDEFVTLGLAEVSTFIASGNVLFTAPGHVSEAHIEAHLAARFGWPVPTFVRTAAELASIATLSPFGAPADGYTHMVAFCRSEPGRAVEALSSERDRLEVHGRQVHWLIHGGVSTSGITLPKLAKQIGANTTRNITTVTKLAALLHAGDQ